MTRTSKLSLILSTSRLKADRRGGAAVEFAILAPVLLLLAVGTADFSMALYQSIAVCNAAASGAAYTSNTFAADGFSSTATATAVTSATALTQITASPAPTEYCGCPGATTGVATATCGSTCTSGAVAGIYVSVTAKATYALLLKYGSFPTSLTLQSTSVVRVQ